jgi:hypothetical protein
MWQLFPPPRCKSLIWNMNTKIKLTELRQTNTEPQKINIKKLNSNLKQTKTKKKKQSNDQLNLVHGSNYLLQSLNINDKIFSKLEVEMLSTFDFLVINNIKHKFINTIYNLIYKCF